MSAEQVILFPSSEKDNAVYQWSFPNHNAKRKPSPWRSEKHGGARPVAKAGMLLSKSEKNYKFHRT